MHIKIYLVLFTFISCSLNTTDKDDKDYIDYFQKINSAELLIGSSDYGKALGVYEELIKTYPNHFYKDLHNACVCALKLGRYDEALYLARDLVNHGYELKDFESQAFDSFRNQKKYWSKFLYEYPRLRNQYEKNLNLPLRDKYMALYKIDQLEASAPNGIREQDSVLYELAVSLSKLIKEDGFPHWMLNKDTINMHFYVMLRHYCGLKNKIMYSEELQQDSLYAQMKNNDISLLMEQALHKGLITPDIYENAATYYDYNNPYGRPAIMIDFNTEKVYPFLQADTAKIPEINNRRAQIGLPALKGQLSDSLLYSTWYKFYPFQEIREAFLSCDTCSTILDFLDIKHPIEDKIRNKFSEKKEKDFILPDWTEIRDIHNMGFQKMRDQKQKKNDTDTK